MKKTKIFTIISCFLSGILWLLGLLTLTCNLFGIWGYWNLAGFAFLFYIPIPIIPTIYSTVLAIKSKTRKLILANLISTAITLASVLFYFFVSTNWFW